MYLLVVFSPFVGSALAGLCGRWLGLRGASFISIFCLWVSFMLSMCIFYEVGMQGCNVWIPLTTWMKTSSLHVSWCFQFDSLTACLLLTVTFVSFCVHLYSNSYMQASPHLPSFMSYLSLFTGFMCVLVTASNFAQMLIGWEGIGVCSYLLIGFWLCRVSATKSALKAMLVNRVSDTLLMISLMLIWWFYGSLDYDILWASTSQAYYTDFMCITLLCGACGKSAQLGFHIWLADAMEGPTPVSALIHAATLVTAGVFLIARTSPLWSCSVLASQLLTIIGTMTCFVAATCGLFQNDLKKVIAYSTCSQLGYMMVSCGCYDYAGAIYHLMTHACFKALLFLSAGTMIHALADNQDMRHYGGTQWSMPFAFTCFLLGSLSLTGFPFLSGFYSKDGILELAYNSSNDWGIWAYLILMIVACFTSFYSFSLLFCSFMSFSSTKQTEDVSGGCNLSMWLPLVFLSMGSMWAGFLMYDLCIGHGTDFWQTSMAAFPGLTDQMSNHELSVFSAWLPLISVFTGFILAAGYNWWLPTQSMTKSIYLFFCTTWQFNPIMQTQMVHSIVTFGGYTLSFLDKGILEWIGPAGLTYSLWNYWVPQTRHMQTGTMHDYALVYKMCVLLGILALTVPGFMDYEMLFDLSCVSVIFVLFWCITI